MEIGSNEKSPPIAIEKNQNSGGRFGANSTANLAYSPCKWAKRAELAVLFSWQLQNGPHYFFSQLPWVPIFHLSSFPLSIECPNLLDIIKFS
jgi:hypothetical protein